MKFSSSTIIGLSTLCVLTISTLLLSPVHAQTTCIADYQCNIPYGYCSGQNVDCTSTFDGLAVDSATSTLYYTAVCGTSSNYNITIKQVSANGGPASTIYSEAPLQEGGNINKVFTVVNGLLYVSRVEREPGSNLVTFNLQSGAQNTVPLNPGFFQPELDIVNGASYSCQLDFGTPNNYTIERFSGVVGQTASSNGIRLYSLGSTQCGPVRRGTGTDIFFTGVTVTPSSTTTAFYKGSVTGSNTLPAVYFTVNENVNDFVVDFSSGAIIYATDSGLYKRAVGGATTTIYTGAVYGIVIYNNRIYFNDGSNIRDTNLDGTNQQQVTTQSTGTCTCRPNFSGSDCQTCSGQVQWSDNGVPSCVPVNQAGVPELCSYDYQCGNVPYTVCEDNSCACRENFTGPKCDQCASTVTWSNGVPSCN